MQAQRARLLEFWQEVMSIRKPLIAAVDGECLGGGLEIAMACDIVYASQQSTFALPDIKVGLIPGGGGTQRLTRRVGKARAMEMILLGESCAPSYQACSLHIRSFPYWDGASPVSWLVGSVCSVWPAQRTDAVS